MAILFEGKKDLVDDVRLDRAEVIAAAAVDAVSGEEAVQWHSQSWCECLLEGVIGILLLLFEEL